MHVSVCVKRDCRVQQCSLRISDGLSYCHVRFIENSNVIYTFVIYTKTIRFKAQNKKILHMLYVLWNMPDRNQQR